MTAWLQAAPLTDRLDTPPLHKTHTLTSATFSMTNSLFYILFYNNNSHSVWLQYFWIVWVPEWRSVERYRWVERTWFRSSKFKIITLEFLFFFGRSIASIWGCGVANFFFLSIHRFFFFLILLGFFFSFFIIRLWFWNSKFSKIIRAFFFFHYYLLTCRYLNYEIINGSNKVDRYKGLFVAFCWAF